MHRKSSATEVGEHIVITGGLTAEEEDLLLALLRKVKQPYSPAFFEALTELLPVMGLEGVVLRRHDGRMQVLMTRRPDDDLIAEWAGKWHIPGTILRVRETIAQAFKRLGGKEFGAELTNIRFVYFIFVPGGGRGSNLQLVFEADLAEGQEPQPGARWFDVESLPPICIDGHHDIVRQVVQRRGDNAPTSA